MMKKTNPVYTVRVGDRVIGDGYPVFIIAEAGVNHNGSLDLALKLVDAAADAGADAVKFQTFKADLLVTADAPKAEYQIRTTGASESQYDMLKKLELDEAAHEAIIARCRERDILFLSTPFDEESANLLQKLDVPAFKLSSGDLTNLPLLCHVARKGKPVIMSTGMATLEETAKSVNVLREAGCRQLILLHCVSNYPADPRDANLRAIETLRKVFELPAGFSDHTEGDAVALGAVALRACVVEKHLTLDRSLPGPDHQASIEPHSFTALVQQIRTVEAALGNGIKVPVPSEARVAKVARKSLFAIRAIPAGTVLCMDMITVKRPGTGLPPEALSYLIGRRALSDIPDGALLKLEMFE